VLEPTGADSPSQNGSMEIYNDELAIRARTLLYGSGLPAKYWSSALMHSVYLHNRMVHATTRKTPFESLYRIKPDISHLKIFGSRVCVKQSGKRHSKLDCHDFKGLFLGYTATDQNIVDLDLDSGVVKQSHHAQFDEAWYLQDSRPPAAQLLFDLGVTDDAATYMASGVLYDESVVSEFCLPGTVEPVQVPWPPCAPGKLLTPKEWQVPDLCTWLRLPLPNMPVLVPTRRSVGAKAATAHAMAPTPRRARPPRARDIMLDFDVTRRDMAMVYMSPDPYFDALDETINVKHVNLKKHTTASLELYESSGRVFLQSMTPGTAAAKIPDWRTRLRGAWLIKIGNTIISSMDDASSTIRRLIESGARSVTLQFSHPEIRPNLSCNGLPIVSSAPFTQHVHDQLNNWWEFTTVASTSSLVNQHISM
jgi:hypothetical protein